MSTNITTNVVDLPLIFSVTESTIESQRESILAIRINGIDDEEGMKLAKSAKSRVVTARTTIEAERKSAKEPHLIAGREIDDRAKSLTALVAGLEAHLTNEIRNVETAKTRAEEQSLDTRFIERRQLLNAAGGGSDTGVRLMTDLDFTAYLTRCAEENRLNSEREAERLRQQEEIRKQRQEVEEERAKIASERAEIDRNRAEQQRVQNEQIAKEYAARREREAEDRRIAAEKRWLEMATDRELIGYFAARCRQIEIPKLSVEAHRGEEALRLLLDGLCDRITQIGGQL